MWKALKSLGLPSKKVQSRICLKRWQLCFDDKTKCKSFSGIILQLLEVLGSAGLERLSGSLKLYSQEAIKSDTCKKTYLKCCNHLLSTNYKFTASLICTRTCAYQGVRNVGFAENFTYVLKGWPPTRKALILIKQSPGSCCSFEMVYFEMAYNYEVVYSGWYRVLIYHSLLLAMNSIIILYLKNYDNCYQIS